MADSDARPAAYVGRFAPTPSGPLHLGSIIAALAGWLDARRSGGRWLLRIDDLDPPRIRPGAVDNIFYTLESLGLHWDDEIAYQSRRGEAYRAALASLQAGGLIYPCYCPRRLIRGRPYPGTCRVRRAAPRPARRPALRVLAGADRIEFEDAVQGGFSQLLAEETGDFIVRRADGLIAYHLANVVDDAWLGVTRVVRGADLLPATPPQIRLQQLLGLPVPAYCHVPVALTADGIKISKSADAGDVLQHAGTAAILVHALRFLGQSPPPALERANAGEVLDWAVAHWECATVPAVRGRDYREAFSS